MAIYKHLHAVAARPPGCPYVALIGTQHWIGRHLEFLEFDVPSTDVATPYSVT